MLKNIGKNWTREEESELVLHFKKYAIDFERISTIHGRTIKAIKMRLEMMIQRDVDNKMNIDDICKKYNCKKSYIECILSDQPKVGTEKKTTLSIDKRLEQLELLLIRIQKKQNRILKLLQN